MQTKEYVCISHTIKLHLEGALIHYIRKIQKDIVTFSAAAVEFKERNPPLSAHYLVLVDSERKFIEELEASKGVIKSLPECSENPHNPGRLTVPEQHQLKIAKDTLKMPDAIAGIMGGPTKEEAREIIKKLEGKK